MPTISTFFGIAIQMYWRDHPPPHIHIFYGGAEALMAIESGEIIAGQLPKPVTRLVRDWAARRRHELLLNWKRAEQRDPLEQIPGADTDD